MATSELGDAAPAPTVGGAPADPSAPIAAAAPVGSVMPWWLPISRAAIAIAAAVVITFTGGHSAQYGLIVLTGWLAATAAVDLVAWRILPKGLPRTASFGRGVVGLLGALLAGLAAIGVLGAMHDVERAAVLGLTAAATLLVIGMFEAGVGVKTKGTDAYSRDWTTAGTIQIIAAIAIMFVPPGFEHRYQVEDVDGILTGAIIVVGLIGATAAILGVLLAIAGISLRSATRSAAVRVADGAPADGTSGEGAPSDGAPAAAPAGSDRADSDRAGSTPADSTPADGSARP